MAAIESRCRESAGILTMDLWDGGNRIMMPWIWLWTKAFYPCCEHPSDTFLSLLIIKNYYFITIIILLLDGGNRIMMPRICRESDFGPPWDGGNRIMMPWIWLWTKAFYPCCEYPSDILDLAGLWCCFLEDVERRVISTIGCQTINVNYYYLIILNFNNWKYYNIIY